MFVFPYTGTELTQQVNRYPNLYGLMNALNLFPAQPSASRTVEIRYEEGKLTVLAASDVRGVAQTAERETGETIFLEIPHFRLLETILPADLQDFIQVIGGAKVPASFDSEVAKRLRFIRGSHAITREYLRNSALKGLIRDGKGKVLHDLFAKFEIQQKVLTFTLSDPKFDVISKCAELVNYYGENMKGETMSSIEVEVDTGFMNKLVQHPMVEKFWLNTQNAGQLASGERNRLGGQWGRVFEFQSIMFRENTSVFPVRDAQGKPASEKAVADNTGHAYPVGTMDSFVTFDGPANNMAGVNKPGTEIHVSVELLKHNGGVEFESQSNALPICKRPEFLVKLTAN